MAPVKSLFAEFQAAIDAVRATKTGYDQALGKVEAERIAYDSAVVKAREIKAQMDAELSELMPIDAGRVRSA